MIYCILAAGDGSRLVSEGVAVSKPLVKILDKPMIGRLMDQMQKCGAEEILIVLNARMLDTRQYLDHYRASSSIPITVIERNTPSSLHSFYELSPHIHGDKFILTTVDTIFRTSDFERYVQEFVDDADSLAFMAVTTYIDDEKPLYVQADANMDIVAFNDTDNPPTPYVSGGIYGLTGPTLQYAKQCIESGQSHMRNFQRSLLGHGQRVKAWDFGKIIDVDHAADIEKANEFLSTPN